MQHLGLRSLASFFNLLRTWIMSCHYRFLYSFFVIMYKFIYLGRIHVHGNWRQLSRENYSCRELSLWELIPGEWIPTRIYSWRELTQSKLLWEIKILSQSQKIGGMFEIENAFLSFTFISYLSLTIWTTCLAMIFIFILIMHTYLALFKIDSNSYLS